MRYRKLSPAGDSTFCSGATSFLVDTPEAVAQAARTRMRLYAGEWFLDKREGLNLDLILGYGTQDTRDREVQQRILNTKGVTAIDTYSSQVDSVLRAFVVSATIDTLYGKATIKEALR